MGRQAAGLPYETAQVPHTVFDGNDGPLLERARLAGAGRKGLLFLCGYQPRQNNAVDAHTAHLFQIIGEAGREHVAGQGTGKAASGGHVGGEHVSSCKGGKPSREEKAGMKKMKDEAAYVAVTSKLPPPEKQEACCPSPAGSVCCRGFIKARFNSVKE
jgi:hypothetical protein